MIEMVVAMGVMAVATALAIRLVGISRQSDRNANDRLVRTLAIDNAAAQLRSIPYDAIDKTADSIRETSQLTIQRRPFETQSRNGIHLVIQSIGDTGTLTHQLWRWGPNE